MAVLGFSHITSEVADIESSLEFYRRAGFDLKFRLTMLVAGCKQVILKHRAPTTELAYLVYQGDEACNLELIEHKHTLKVDCPPAEKIKLTFMTNRVSEEKLIKDSDGNEIRILPSQGKTGVKTKHFFLPVKDVAASSRFYQQVFDMCEAGAHALTFPKCLHPNWDGYLHLVEEKSQSARRKYLDELGFHSFCFLVSSRDNDIYAKVPRDKVVGPIQEEKMIGHKKIAFEVGFVHDPDGYPVEYLLLS